MMTPNPETQHNRAKLQIWWIVWGSVLVGLVLLYFLLGRGTLAPRALPPEKMLTGMDCFSR